LIYYKAKTQQAARNQKIAKKIAVERDQIIDKLIDQIKAWELKNNCN
jgi:translation initiation factor IF-2